jgi:UTP-glucose-1-phosphate uridylyltransferase
MDQGCAYGNRPIEMVFDGDRLDIVEMNVPRELHFVIVDLQAGKDTKEILKRLNHCYPFAEDDVQRGVQKYLGPINAAIVAEAAEALRKGDAKEIGRLMKEAQTEFDRHLQPACPSQLTAPVLHKVLNYGPIQPHVLGGKGVGSQGDGTAQFIVRDASSQNQVVEILQRDLKMPCLKLVIRPGRRVRKAVIPAAGFGTRLFPATKVMKKELFPVIGRDGRIKPVILAIVEEALSAGIEQVAVIVQTADRDLFETFFGTPPAVENFNKLSKESQEYSRYLLEVGRHVTLIPQDVQDGFGHAVFRAREWVRDEPFLLLLGDHLYASEVDASCARQVLDVYDRLGQSVVGLKKTPADDVRHFGCVTGTWEEPDAVLAITEFAEKPDIEYARRHLHVDGMEDDLFLSVFGIYALKPAIFDYLEENIRNNVRERGEFQLTSCLDRLRQEDGFRGYVVKGRRFDIGLPEAYRQAVIDFRNA